MNPVRSCIQLSESVWRSYSPDFRIRITEWECPLGELLEFGEYVRERAALAMDGDGEFAPGEKTCKFCRARKQCRAEFDYNVKQAFALGELPPLITNEEAGKRLLAMRDVAAYQKDLQEWALSECLAGKEVPGWKAVEGRRARDWTDMDAAFEKLTKSGVVAEDILGEKTADTGTGRKDDWKERFCRCRGRVCDPETGKTGTGGSIG